MQDELKRPRFHALRRFLFHNFWLKLLAFVLAVIIYLTLRSGISVNDGDYFRDKAEPAQFDLKDKLANAER